MRTLRLALGLVLLGATLWAVQAQAESAPTSANGVSTAQQRLAQKASELGEAISVVVVRVF